MDASRIQLAHDAEDDVIFVEMRGVQLDTRADIDTFFDSVLSFWRSRCGTRKVYFVVCYDDFAVNLRENGHYAARMLTTAAECAIQVIRFGGDALQRSAARLRGVKIHMPSNLYDSRAQALEVVRQLRSGATSIATT